MIGLTDIFVILDMPIKSAASVPGSSSSNTVQLGKGTKSTPSTGKKRKRKNDSMIEDEIGTTFAIEVAEYNIRNIRAEHGTEADKDTEKKVRTKTHEVGISLSC